MLKSYYIYIATCSVTGMSYIGFTANLDTRMKQHKYSSFNENCNAHQHHFHRAIRKYGFETFTWKILIQTLDRKYCQNVLEPKYIKEYDTKNMGYNETFGGEGTNHTRKPHTEEWKVNHGNKLRGRKRPEHSLKMKGHRSWNKGTIPWNKGLKLPDIVPWSKGLTKITDERLQKLSEKISQTLMGRDVKIWLLIFPTGETHMINGIKEAEKYGLPYKKALVTAKSQKPLQKGEYAGWSVMRYAEGIN